MANTIMQTLGRGSLGKCVEYKVGNKVYAMKMVPNGVKTKARVENEIALYKNLNHPNVIRYMTHLNKGGKTCIVMELCYVSLQNILDLYGGVSEPEARHFMIGLVKGLRYIHQQHIVHRDLKPANVMVDKNGQIKIIDFDLSTKIKKNETLSQLCGTPKYLSPELLERNYGYDTDTWALGCIFHELLSGEQLFDAQSLWLLSNKIKAGDFTVSERVSDTAAELIVKMLAHNPADRPALDEILNDKFFDGPTQVMDMMSMDVNYL